MFHMVILQNDVKFIYYLIATTLHTKIWLEAKQSFHIAIETSFVSEEAWNYKFVALFHLAITPRPQRARWIYSIRYFSSPFQRMNPTPLKLKKHCNLQVITCCYNDKNCHLPTQDRNKTQMKLFWREVKLRNYNMHRTT